MAIERFVVGFLFDDDGNVALIQKNRPSWQKGRLNGVGGHIEAGETPVDAMIREFQEEAGVKLSWRQFCVLTGDGYRLHCFVSKDKTDIRTKTDEKVAWYTVDNLPPNILPNLAWLIPMANYKFDITTTVIHPSKEC